MHKMFGITAQKGEQSTQYSMYVWKFTYSQMSINPYDKFLRNELVMCTIICVHENSQTLPPPHSSKSTWNQSLSQKCSHLAMGNFPWTVRNLKYLPSMEIIPCIGGTIIPWVNFYVLELRLLTPNNYFMGESYQRPKNEMTHN